MVVERQVVVGDVHRPSDNIISKQQMIYLSKTKSVFKWLISIILLLYFYAFGFKVGCAMQ